MACNDKGAQARERNERDQHPTRVTASTPWAPGRPLCP